MKYTQGKYIITEKQAIAREIYSLTISCPEVAAAAQPGQFVHIRANGFTLRRPISICGIDREKGTLRIVFEIRGEGTAEIARLNTGDLIDMLAPLGHGFTTEGIGKAIMVGGGIGTPPMLPLAQIFGKNGTVIAGFRNAAAVILQDDFRKTGADVVPCTDDGSYGWHGLVTEPLAAAIERDKPDAVFACGPMPMLKGVAKVCADAGVYCEISLEERMACGIGACLGCACRTKRNDEEYFAHVCKDGPVFKAEEVIW